jgi:hypothetical protein
MADKRISEFVAATAAAAADLLVIVQGGTNKKLTVANLFGAINTPFNFNPSQTDTDAVFMGQTDTDLVHVDASANSVGVGTATPQQKLDVNGSLGTNGAVVHKAVETLSAAGAISLTKRSTLLDTTSSFSATLADGTTGLTKQLVSKNTGTVTVTATTPAGWTQIVFNAAYQTATLEWQDGKWVITGSRGATIS